jgi:HEAT repeat protein
MSNINLQSEDPNLRREAIEEYFYNTPDDETLKDLVKHIEDEDKGVRNSLAILLTTTENQNAPEYLVPYVSSEDISVRNLAGDTLLKNGNNSVKALTDYIDIGNDDDKKFCIDLLGLIGNPDPCSKIIEVLETNKDQNVILACLEALGNLQCIDAIENIQKFFSVNELYKPTVIEALGKIGSRKVQDFLVGIYEKEDELTQYAIIESIGLIGDADSLGMLISELKKSGSFMIGALLKSIFLIKERTSVAVLLDEATCNKVIKEIDSLDAEYIKPAINIIQNTPDIDILSICIKVFGLDFELDEDLKQTLTSHMVGFAEFLPKYFLTEPSNIHDLLSFLKELSQMAPENIEIIINSEAKTALVDSFKTLLISPNEEIRSLAGDMLFVFDIDAAMDAAEILIEDESVWNRINLLDNLSNISLERTHSLIERLANDEDEMVKERAVFLIDQNVSN